MLRPRNGSHCAPTIPHVPGCRIMDLSVHTATEQPLYFSQCGIGIHSIVQVDS